MRVLIIGSGAREHALAWKFKRFPLATDIRVYPGNGALNALGFPSLETASKSVHDIVKAAKAQSIDLAVIGPENFLADGIADAFLAAQIPVFGPTQAAAQLESSKAFSKLAMQAAGVPTAPFQVVSDAPSCRAAATKMLRAKHATVIKASGLAAGKGVFVCHSEADIDAALNRLYSPSMAEAAREVVVEEALVGREVSYFCMLGRGQNIPLGFAVDYKRLRDGNQGPNTGGMGCYTPVPWLPKTAQSLIEARVIEPILKHLHRIGIDYCGWLYCGLMWTDQGPQVIEFNCRLGDPETQVLAVHDRSDWLMTLAYLAGVTNKRPSQSSYATNSGFTLCSVLASNCYPYGEIATINNPLPLNLFKLASPDAAVFGASVNADGPDSLLSGRGRVLSIVQTSSTLEEARDRLYRRVREVASIWPSAQWRSDIGLDLIQ